MSKTIKKLIKKHRHRLTWPVTVVTGPEVGTLEIMSDHAAKTHTIYIPDNNVRDIEYLHEIGHATLCERVHPMFSTPQFATTDPAVLNEIAPATRAASDWFVDHWLITLAPGEERHEIEEHARGIARVLKHQRRGDPELLCMAALMFAQAIKYCGWQLSLGGDIERAVNALFAVEPSRPSIDRLTATINGLLACYSRYRVELFTDGSGTCWRII